MSKYNKQIALADAQLFSGEQNTPPPHRAVEYWVNMR